MLSMVALLGSPRKFWLLERDIACFGQQNSAPEMAVTVCRVMTAQREKYFVADSTSHAKKDPLEFQGLSAFRVCSIVQVSFGFSQSIVSCVNM